MEARERLLPLHDLDQAAVLLNSLLGPPRRSH